MADSLSNEAAKTPKVAKAIGTRPGYKNHNVVFVANLMGLFFGNEEETEMLAAEVGEIDSYGGRLVPIINLIFGGSEENLLVLEHSPDRDLIRYFEDTAGLDLPEIAVLSHSDYLTLGDRLERGEILQHEASRRICDHGAGALDGYVTDDILEGLAGRIGKSTFSSVPGSRRGNNKWLLHKQLETLGLPVPATVIAESAAAIPDGLAGLKGEGYSSAVIKAPMGASGIGLIKVESLEDCSNETVEVPPYFFTEGPCLVQGWLKPGEFGVESIRSPSVQLFLDEDTVMLYDMTEQILSQDSVHEGNESPPPYLDQFTGLKEELLRQAGLAGSWLHKEGYRGTGSVDFLVAIDSSGDFTVYVCEINARVTGATYPAVLARHFQPEGAWLLRNLRFTKPVSGDVIIDLLARSNDLFVPGQTERGVFPVNFNFGKDGLIHKGQFLCLSSSPEENHELLRFAEKDLPCTPDRD